MSIDVETVHIDKGEHKSPGDGHCLMEVVAMFTGGPFTDRPSCVSHVLRNFGMALNDQWDDARRQDLRRFIPLLPGTAGDGLDEARGYLALDWLVRTFAPTWLDLAGLADHAAELRAAAPITGTGSAAAALPLITAARAAARDAAGHAARDAARAAAKDAAKVALQPTVDTLQASALDLYGRMIHPAVTP
jgi:hypothetical protein